MSETLRPCAHCGMKAAYLQNDEQRTLYWVECNACGLRTKNHWNRNEVIDHWNRRYTDEMWAMEPSSTGGEHWVIDYNNKIVLAYVRSDRWGTHIFPCYDDDTADLDNISGYYKISPPPLPEWIEVEESEVPP